MINAWKIAGAMSKTYVRVVDFCEIHFYVVSVIVFFYNKTELTFRTCSIHRLTDSISNSLKRKKY